MSWRGRARQRSYISLTLHTLTAAVSLRYLRKSLNSIVGLLQDGSGALGTNELPHVRVNRSYSLLAGSFRAAARFWAGEEKIQLGPSFLSSTSWTLGMRGRREACPCAAFGATAYLSSSSSSCLSSCWHSAFDGFECSSRSAAIPTVTAKQELGPAAALALRAYWGWWALIKMNSLRHASTGPNLRRPTHLPFAAPPSTIVLTAFQLSRAGRVLQRCCSIFCYHSMLHAMGEPCH